MDESVSPSFDKYAGEYDEIQRKNIGSLVKNLDVLAQYKVELTKTLLHRTPGTILEFGCGTGRNLPFLSRAFPDSAMYACDISSESLTVARRNNPGVTFFDSSSRNSVRGMNIAFDLIFMAGVLHHIPPHERMQWIAMLGEVLSHTGGGIAVFEHNPYNPVTRYLVNTCPFDEGVRLVRMKECIGMFHGAGLKIDSAMYTLLFPWRRKFLEKLERRLSFLPLGGQFCVIGSRSRSGSPK